MTDELSTPAPPQLADIGSLVEFRPSQLVFTRHLSIEEWEMVGDWLMLMDDALQWWIGDWIRHGEAAYGEKYTQYIELTGKALSTLQSYVYVAEHVPPAQRRAALRFSHHAEVASLPPGHQAELLTWAEENGTDGKPASVTAMRAEKERRYGKAHDWQTCPVCHGAGKVERED